jgi:hypothetical protein
MKGVFKLFAVFFVCLLSPGVFAQNTGWDGALDRYEKACRILVDYRERMKIGETIPVDSLSSITSQLETLRRDMNRLPGQMTAMQRHRYSAISEMYRNGTPMPSFARIVPIRWAAPFVPITNIYGRHDNAKLDYTPKYFLYNAPYYPKSFPACRSVPYGMFRVIGYRYQRGNDSGFGSYCKRNRAGDGYEPGHDDGSGGGRFVLWR